LNLAESHVLQTVHERKNYDKKRYFIKAFDELFVGKKNHENEIELAEHLYRYITDDLDTLKTKGNEYILQQIQENNLCFFTTEKISIIHGVWQFIKPPHSFSFEIPDDIQDGDRVLASDGGHNFCIVTITLNIPLCIDLVLDTSSIDVYLDNKLQGQLPCEISAPSGNHVITIKQGINTIGTKTVNFIHREKEKHSVSLSIPDVSKGNNGTSSNTLALLTLLGIASSPFAMEGMEGFPLFSFFFIGFIGVFYKKKWGSILAMLSGLIAFISSNPPIMFLLGIIVIYLSWREYSALKTS